MANRNGLEVPEHILLREYVRIIVSAFSIDDLHACGSHNLNLFCDQ
ncbi:hypothetical protein [Bacillus atrophaeus]|nr:hypothetical protein [Bacillus atrophaeus]MDL5144229.1 hypothetical protein [Bacillus atrophaeus]